jgi:hypothetical protein
MTFIVILRISSAPFAFFVANPFRLCTEKHSREKTQKTQKEKGGSE